MARSVPGWVDGRALGPWDEETARATSCVLCSAAVCTSFFGFLGFVYDCLLFISWTINVESVSSAREAREATG